MFVVQEDESNWLAGALCLNTLVNEHRNLLEVFKCRGVRLIDHFLRVF